MINLYKLKQMFRKKNPESKVTSRYLIKEQAFYVEEVNLGGDIYHKIKIETTKYSPTLEVLSTATRHEFTQNLDLISKLKGK